MASKKIRLLVDHPIDGQNYRANVVVDLDAALAKQLVKDGVADDNDAAVAYALEQNGGAVAKHEAQSAASDAQ